MNEAIGPVGFLCLLVVGFALLWARQLAYRDRHNHAEDPLRITISIAAWLAIMLGVAGPIIQGLLYVSPFGLTIVAGIAIMFVSRYREMERRSLLRSVALAAQTDIPLPAAARAFADERTDGLGTQAHELAVALEQGRPLPQALIQSRTRMPHDLALAVRVGTETGQLGESIRRIARFNTELDASIRGIFESFLYFAWVGLTLSVNLTFLLLKIVPVFEKMFREFGLQLPPLTKMLVWGSDQAVAYWPLLLVIYLPASALAILGALQYLHLLPRGLPGIAWLFRRSDSSVLMRVLALAVHQRWPMDKTVAMLSRVYPSRPVRTQLARVISELNQGRPWCDAFHSARLFRTADVELFRIAERIGNLEWALDEASESTLRRVAFRLRVVANLVLPWIVILMGLLVGFVVVALFMPLVSLIQGMS